MTLLVSAHHLDFISIVNVSVPLFVKVKSRASLDNEHRPCEARGRAHIMCVGKGEGVAWQGG